MNHTDPPRWVTALAIALFIAAVVAAASTPICISGVLPLRIVSAINNPFTSNSQRKKQVFPRGVPAYLI